MGLTKGFVCYVEKVIAVVVGLRAVGSETLDAVTHSFVKRVAISGRSRRISSLTGRVGRMAVRRSVRQSILTAVFGGVAAVIRFIALRAVVVSGGG